MKHIKSIVMAALAVVIAGSSVLSATSVSAQSSAALSIVPKKNYTIEPGKSVSDKLTIRNLDGEKPLNLTLRVVDFTFNDDGGTPKLFLAADAPQTTWSLKPYLKVPTTVTVPARQTKTIDMSVSIPRNQGAGSYYSAIVYSSGAPDGGNVGLSASGVTLAFVSIPGQVKEDLKLEKFGAYHTGKREYTYFSVDEPHNIAYTLKNNGNVTEAPSGNITLNGWFGKPITIDNVNPNSSLALIGQTRTYTACIKLAEQQVDFNGEKTDTRTCEAPGLFPGYYSATLNLFYGQNGNRTQEIVGAGSFWYMPWWFIVLLIVIIAALAYAGWKANRFIRSKFFRTQYKKKSSRRK